MQNLSFPNLAHTDSQSIKEYFRSRINFEQYGYRIFDHIDLNPSELGSYLAYLARTLAVWPSLLSVRTEGSLSVVLCSSTRTRTDTHKDEILMLVLSRKSEC